MFALIIAHFTTDSLKLENNIGEERRWIGCRDFDITEIDITESDVTETDITENDITESNITESDITRKRKLL